MDVIISLSNQILHNELASKSVWRKQILNISDIFVSPLGVFEIFVLIQEACQTCYIEIYFN